MPPCGFGRLTLSAFAIGNPQSFVIDRLITDAIANDLISVQLPSAGCSAVLLMR